MKERTRSAPSRRLREASPARPQARRRDRSSARAALLQPAPPRDLMACLGEVSRFGLVGFLTNGPRCVSDLAREIGLSQSCTTRHLQRLARSGIIRARRDGKRVLVELCVERSAVRALVGWALSPRGDSKALARSNRNPERASGARGPAPARPAPRRRTTPAAAAPPIGSPAANPTPDAPVAPERESEAGPGENSAPADLRYRELEDFLL